MQVPCAQCGEPVSSERPICGACGQPAFFGKYRVLGTLGSGGMGTVYRCEHPELRRSVAIKVLNADAFRNPETLARFRREARALAALQHPGIVQVFDVDTGPAGAPFLVMEFAGGERLHRLIKKGPLATARALRIARDVARALDYAHAHDVIHRDIKPSNIVIDADDRPRLLDFGLAKVLKDTSVRTVSGEILGTPAYMAPEQISGRPEEIDARTDVYALGIVLYEMLTGCRAYADESVMTVLKKIETSTPPAPRLVNPATPEEVEEVCLRAMARKKEDRFASAKEFVQALEGLLAEMVTEGPTPTRRRRTRSSWIGYGIAAGLGGGLAIAGIVALAILFAEGEQPAPSPGQPPSPPSSVNELQQEFASILELTRGEDRAIRRRRLLELDARLAERADPWGARLRADVLAQLGRHRSAWRECERAGAQESAEYRYVAQYLFLAVLPWPYLHPRGDAAARPRHRYPLLGSALADLEQERFTPALVKLRSIPPALRTGRIAALEALVLCRQDANGRGGAEAVEVIGAAAARDENDPLLLWMEAYAEYRAGNFDAGRAAERALEGTVALPDPEVLFTQAVLAEAAFDRDRALACLETQRSLGPVPEASLLWAALVYGAPTAESPFTGVSADDCRAIADDLEPMLVESGHLAGGHLLAAGAWNRLGRRDEVQRHLIELLGLRPAAAEDPEMGDFATWLGPATEGGRAFDIACDLFLAPTSSAEAAEGLLTGALDRIHDDPTGLEALHVYGHGQALALGVFLADAAWAAEHLREILELDPGACEWLKDDAEFQELAARSPEIREILRQACEE